MRLRRRKAPSSPRSLQRSASAKSNRFSLAENCRRVAISITSGSGLGSSEGATVKDRRTLELVESTEEAETLFIEDFDTWDMIGYYLYSKLLRSGLSRHIGTGGCDYWGAPVRKRLEIITITAPAERFLKRTCVSPLGNG